MGSSSANRTTAIACALIAVLTGLVVYLSIARQLDVSEELPPPTNSAMIAQQQCPQCPPVQKRPIFSKLFKPVDFTIDFFGMSYVGNSGNLIDEHVLYFGAYEKDVLFLMRDVVKALGTDDSVFIDVGANTGLHSLFMSKHAAAVHAFEPYEPVLVRFREALERNKIKNVTIHAVGLGNERAQIPFHKPPDKNLGSGSFVPSFQPGNEESSSLQIVVGDEALAEARIKRVDLIKIDIEGYEKPALQGLRKTLEASRPVVAVEVTMSAQMDETFKSADELRAAFPEKYAFVRFQQTLRRAKSGEYELVPFDLEFERVGQAMLLAYPVEKRAQLKLPAAD